MVSLRLKVSAAVEQRSAEQQRVPPEWSPGLAPTRERSQLDTTGHVVVKVDSPSSVVALDDGVQSLRTDAVAWRRRQDVGPRPP